MKRSISIILVLVSMSILLSSCGVMFGGSKYQATIIAKDHPNAEIYVNGKKMGNGQVVTLLPREKNLTVELKEQGCETKTQTFGTSFRTGNFILSVVSWGLFSLIDLGTGAAFKPDRKNPAIQKTSTKDFTFTVDGLNCTK